MFLLRLSQPLQGGSLGMNDGFGYKVVIQIFSSDVSYEPLLDKDGGAAKISFW